MDFISFADKDAFRKSSHICSQPSYLAIYHDKVTGCNSNYNIIDIIESGYKQVLCKQLHNSCLLDMCLVRRAYGIVL